REPARHGRFVAGNMPNARDKSMRWLIALVAILFLYPLQVIAQEKEEEPNTTCHRLGEQEICISEASYTKDVCAAIETYAKHFSLPEGFFARLIWQESRFDPRAISPVGAQGIAQFMPGTARLRKLGDPFDP